MADIEEEKKETATTKITLGLVTCWLFGVSFMVLGLGRLTEGEIALALFLLAPGIIILPPLSELIEARLKISISGWLKVVAAIICLFYASRYNLQRGEQIPDASRSVSGQVEEAKAAPTGNPKLTERVVQTFKGSDTQTTRPFSVAGKWEIQWVPHTGSGIFTIWLKDANDANKTEDLIANQANGSKGSSFQPTGGEYYLKISGDGPWTVRIVSLE